MHDSHELGTDICQRDENIILFIFKELHKDIYLQLFPEMSICMTQNTQMKLPEKTTGK